jgi:hypothetical protein
MFQTVFVEVYHFVSGIFYKAIPNAKALDLAVLKMIFKVNVTIGAVI